MNMNLKRPLGITLVAAGLGLGVPAMAATAYDEAVQGDLSNNRAAPTVITFGIGANDVLGSTGEDDASFRDYGSFVIPANALLTSIEVLQGTVGSEDGLVFFGLQAGSAITVNPTTYAGQENLIGWNHFSSDDVGQGLSLAGEGTVSPLPLAAGPYAFWIQDFDPGDAPYRLRFNVTAAVPEPGSYALMGLGLVGLGIASARRKAMRR